MIADATLDNSQDNELQNSDLSIFLHPQEDKVPNHFLKHQNDFLSHVLIHLQDISFHELFL